MPTAGLPNPMRVSRAALLLLTALLAFPAAGAVFSYEGRSPWDAGYPQNPQMLCAWAYEEPGQDACTVTTNVRVAEIVRVRIAGSAKVHVNLFDNEGPLGLPEQRAVVDCARTCIHYLWGGAHTDPRWTMIVDSEAGGPAVIQVSVESETRLADGSL